MTTGTKDSLIAIDAIRTEIFLEYAKLVSRARGRPCTVQEVLALLSAEEEGEKGEERQEHTIVFNLSSRKASRDLARCLRNG